MTSLGPRSHNYEINAMLRVSKYSEREIRQFFSNVFEVKQNRLNSDLHLTVYHARVPIPGLQVGSHTLDITVDTAETRFMVLVPGGENPHDDIDAGAHSVGIRLTKRNTAIPQIQKLREQIYRLESKAVIGNRKPTSAWTNCFGVAKLPATHTTVAPLAQGLRHLGRNRKTLPKQCQSHRIRLLPG